jgi:putative drug exporter of the RND superfamily
MDVRREPVLARIARCVVRFRYAVLATWLALLILGGIASTGLGPLLANGFVVPHTDSQRAPTILTQEFGDRGDGEYLLVFAARHPIDPAMEAAVQTAVDRAAQSIPSARTGLVRTADRSVLYATIDSRLDLAHSKTDSLLVARALRPPAGVQAYVSGQAAIQRDLDPVFSHDLHHGEFAIALPAALLVLLLVLGVSAIVTLPLLFASATIAATLALVFAVAHATVLATYVTNFVELIGLALAIDYSLLVVYRFREELDRHSRVDDAVARTMATAGRSVVFSGATVMLGLALLLFIPVPFVRSLGIGGSLIPLVSIAAATTLLPALLSLDGRRGSARIAVIARRHEDADGFRGGFWHRLARAIMHRPLLFLAAGSAVLLLAAAPAFALRLTPGSADGVPQTLPSVHGFDLLRSALGPGALSPTQLLIDSGRAGGVTEPLVRAATARLTAQLRPDPEVAALQPVIEPTRRYEELVVIGRHEYGQQAALSFVTRLRATIVPHAQFPGRVRVFVGGGAAQGVDFLQHS